jgi:tRNA A-37 threonylcarbamoyl transferase component Bud32
VAALLPTALIGWWTYRQVESTIEQSVRNELKGVADSVALASQRYLTDKAQLVQSWSRQPSIQTAIAELVELSDSDPSIESLLHAEQPDQIRAQLQQLSGFDDVKFAIWNDSYRTIASCLLDRADVGQPVAPSEAENLARVMSGETVLFGPKRLVDNIDGSAPVTIRPVMAIIVPVQNAQGRNIAALLVRGIGMFDEFSRMFVDVALAGELDAYAVSRDGIMLTENPRAMALATQNQLDLPAEEIAAKLRVADPGMLLTSENQSEFRRAVCPLTMSVAGATTGNSDVRTEAYKNYAGHSVVGAWRWNDDWRLGIIIEQDAEIAFAPVRIVRFGFLLLGSLLFVTAFAAAAVIARTSTAEQAAVHPLNRYELISELGSGGMGVVYRARHRQLGRDTALKVLSGGRNSKEDRLRFDREARLAASLSNPHSVMIYDYGRSEDGEAFCVMEFLRGLTLQEVVARSGHQPIGRVLFIVSQICDALAEAHGMNLLHRDVKPQNIMLSLDASVGDWAVIFDYGLAKPLEPVSGVYQTSEMIWSGTPMYMAPERFREPSVMDPRSDIYSVGCVAYYLLSGRPPFIECDPESLFALILSAQPISIAVHRDEEVPREISDLVMKCMAKNAGDRYPTVTELAREIDRLRASYPWTVDEARAWWKHNGNE